MPFGLISLHDEMRLFSKIKEFYSRLYPRLKFSLEEKSLKPAEIGELLYTYGGEETESLAAEKMKDIEDALPEYAVPAVLLKKGESLVVLDGHRRLRLAWKLGIPWKALVLVPDEEAEFGIADTAVGKIRELYGARKKGRPPLS